MNFRRIKGNPCLNIPKVAVSKLPPGIRGPGMRSPIRVCCRRQLYHKVVADYMLFFFLPLLFFKFL